ncbi:MAG: biopolymer transporter ExbD [Lentisphaerae bacterium]|nr:biopolymer transporter ExbD [Lentisphaerota bacterium]
MARKKMRSQLDAIDQINITPLLDLTFMLLIVFMITTPLMENGIDVTPPTMNADKLQTEKTMRNLTITRDGSLTLEKLPVSRDLLLQELQKIKQNDPDAVLLLRADGSREYKEVIEVMRIIRDSGFKNVQLVTLSDGQEQ